eukprot:TRINITY_DN2976_c0_g1_i1.p1 TRINITY_DN2976_c0_g1~~TRINITY_DN2976_c0_g1_i1.p1  ORF type:complete len:479 (+),score=57.30 TRINITY_DN2976_c0_g1_i1:199-1437(+)
MARLTHATVSIVVLFSMLSFITTNAATSIRENNSESSHVLLYQNTSKLIKLDTTTFPDAVCNDGSPGAFYFRPGSNSSRWIIHLQGGFWCWDDYSCSSRAVQTPALVSSTGYSPTNPSYIGTNGMFSVDPSTNPTFHDANIAYIMYCSSDAWSGAGNNTVNGTLWQFQGRAIIDGVIQTVASSMGMDQADDVLFSGCSAGGQGVINSLDYAADLIQTYTKNDVVVKGVADAGWMMAITPLNPAMTYPIIEQFIVGIDLWQGYPNEMCRLSNPSNPYLCYISQYAWPHMQTPVLIQANQYDLFQLPYDSGQFPPYTNATVVEYVDMIQQAFFKGMQMVTAPSAFYSAACYDHCFTESDEFFTVSIPTYPAPSSGDVTLQQVLTAWFLDNDAEPQSAQDDCEEFNCSDGCPAYT